ncbi:MAG: glycosyltransferase family 2 protein, partial [Thermoleophilaceae bacterium]
SAARNAGWREIGTPLVLFLDDDVLPEPRLVEEHLDWHAHHPGMDVGVLGHVRCARELRVTPFMRWLDRGIQFDYGRIRGDEAGWGRFCTANVSVKRALLEAVDGFDEALPYGYEDLDIAKRAHDQQGFRLLYARNAVGEHLQRTSLELFKGRIERNALAERSFVRLHPEIRPYFRDLFEDARARGPVRGRAARLAAVVPPRMPLLGPWVWERADVYFRQQLAPYFFAAWERAAQEEPAVSASGSSPSGPK